MNDLQRIKLIIKQRFHLYATEKDLKDADVKLELCREFLQEINVIEHINGYNESDDQYINLARVSKTRVSRCEWNTTKGLLGIKTYACSHLIFSKQLTWRLVD